MSRLEGKIAVVTGANSGIGLATAKLFLAEGASRVFLTGRRKAELEKAVGALNATDDANWIKGRDFGGDGKRAVGVLGDVTKPADMARLYEQVKAEVGRVHRSEPTSVYWNCRPISQSSIRSDNMRRRKSSGLASRPP